MNYIFLQFSLLFICEYRKRVVLLILSKGQLLFGKLNTKKMQNSRLKVGDVVEYHVNESGFGEMLCFGKVLEIEGPVARLETWEMDCNSNKDQKGKRLQYVSSLRVAENLQALSFLS